MGLVLPCLLLPLFPVHQELAVDVKIKLVFWILLLTDIIVPGLSQIAGVFLDNRSSHFFRAS